jgi:hypothetical protein
MNADVFRHFCGYHFAENRLNNLGVKTLSQDYVLYVYDHP